MYQNHREELGLSMLPFVMRELVEMVMKKKALLLDDALHNGCFHGIADVKTVAEKALGHLQFLIILIVDFVLIDDDVVHADNRTVAGGAAQVAGNAEQRHKTQCCQNKNTFCQPGILNTSDFRHHGDYILLKSLSVRDYIY